MSAPSQPSSIIAADVRGAILSGFFSLGQNTHQIAKAVDLPEAAVVEIVRQERERRVEVYAGRPER